MTPQARSLSAHFTEACDFEVQGTHTYFVGDADDAALVHNSCVIGRYPAYEKMAQQLGVSYFSVPTPIWEAMADEEKWAANQKFLDRAIQRGEEFNLATPLSEMGIGTYYQRELEYLFSQGYKLNSGGTVLLPP